MARPRDTWSAADGRVGGKAAPELSAMPEGRRAIGCICTDGGQNRVFLLESMG
ncbi:MAG: hypothetical protein U1E21_11865 [Reyranellaceae bacterium]